MAERLSPIVESPGEATQIGRSSSCATASSDGFSTPASRAVSSAYLPSAWCSSEPDMRLPNSGAIITRYSHSSVL